MAEKTRVKRKKHISSYADFGFTAAERLIKPLTKQSFEYSQEFLDKKVTHRTGNLRRAMYYDVFGTAGAVKVKYGPGGGNHAHLVEYGVPSRNIKPKSFLRSGVRKGKREIWKFWKSALEETWRKLKTNGPEKDI